MPASLTSRTLHPNVEKHASCTESKASRHTPLKDPSQSLHANAEAAVAVAVANQLSRRIAKRAIDIVGASIGLLLLLPLLTACAIAVKLTSRGSVFFRQTRIGKGGIEFSLIKFRTMRNNAHHEVHLLKHLNEQDGPAFKIANDPRITPTGRMLRKFSLDELPQLLNVLCGQMSLVGPRPPVPSEVLEYADWQMRRITVKPGLTCIWQVWGRNRVSFHRWMEMDLAYIDNWSIWLDIKLILHTLPAMLRGTGM